MNNIKLFIKKETIFLLLLMIVFINPFFYGYRIALVLGVFIYMNAAIFTKIADKNVLYLFLFTLSYELMRALRIDSAEVTILSVTANIISPVLLYMVGKYITRIYRNSDILNAFLLFLAFSYSVIPLISILNHILENGFIEGTRSIALIWDSSFEISATVLGSYCVLNMASIGLANVTRKSSVEKRLILFYVVMFLISLLAVLRLGSRTMLVIAVVSFMGSFFINIRKNSALKNIIILTLIGAGAFYGILKFDANAEFLTFYADRMDDRESGFDSAGGRTERWNAALQSIVTDPWGWEFERFGYAHNLWLDVARVGGIIPLAFLLLFTFTIVRSWINVLKDFQDYPFTRSTLFLYMAGIILLFFVEPVMDGMYLLFLLFCMISGLIAGIKAPKIKFN